MNFQKEYIKDLKGLVNKDYVLVYGNEDSLGVKLPDLKKYAKYLNKKYELDYLLNNIAENYFEEILLKGYLIILQKFSYEKLEYYLDYYLPKINSWGICDSFVASLKIIKKYRNEVWNNLIKYLNSDYEFMVRFALVVILNYYLEDKYIDSIYNIIKNIKLDKYYVKMANAWLISYLLIKYYDKTIIFLKSNKLDKWTVYKGITKGIESLRINENQKEELKILRNYLTKLEV